MIFIFEMEAISEMKLLLVATGPSEEMNCLV